MAHHTPFFPYSEQPVSDRIHSSHTKSNYVFRESRAVCSKGRGRNRVLHLKGVERRRMYVDARGNRAFLWLREDYRKSNIGIDLELLFHERRFPVFVLRVSFAYESMTVSGGRPVSEVFAPPSPVSTIEFSVRGCCACCSCCVRRYVHRACSISSRAGVFP